MENTTSRLCEACYQALDETIIESNDGRWPYRLCLPCAHRLVTLSLRPLEWFHLAALHGPNEYYLHDDFYSEEGKALQPKDKIVEQEKWPLPEPTQANLATLIDYTITRFHLDENDFMLEIVRQLDSTLLLNELQKRANLLPPTEIEARLYVICAYTLGRKAESWIRDSWRTVHLQPFGALALASSYCLPPSEGFEQVVKRLAMLPLQQVRSACLVLEYFHTEKTLDWLETHIQLPITADWGRVAASSSFSWERAVKWLDSGRPLSLVALDALANCYNYEILHPTFTRHFLGHIPKDTMLMKLEAYQRDDPVPRVKQVVAKLIKRIEQGV